jgi:hypothetical protein
MGMTKRRIYLWHGLRSEPGRERIVMGVNSKSLCRRMGQRHAAFLCYYSTPVHFVSSLQRVHDHSYLGSLVCRAVPTFYDKTQRLQNLVATNRPDQPDQARPDFPPYFTARGTSCFERRRAGLNQLRPTTFQPSSTLIDLSRCTSFASFHTTFLSSN